jgi:hypothetical protein
VERPLDNSCIYSQYVFGSDNEAPPCPDRTSSHQCKVLCEGELLCGSEKVRRASEDNTPFHDWCPAESNNVLVTAMR